MYAGDGMSVKRPATTAHMKLEALKNAHTVTVCHVCEMPHSLEDIEFDHVQALVMGGEHHVSNLKPVCIWCHKTKSANEHRNNSKAKRLQKAREAHEAVLAGEPRQRGSIKSRGFTAWRKFDGSIVRK